MTIETDVESPVNGVELIPQHVPHPLVDLKRQQASNIGSGSPAHGSAASGSAANVSTSSGSTTGRLTGSGWPAPLEPEAFHGIAGEFVRAVEPYSEASLPALLAHFLVMAGCLHLVGPDCHAAVGGAIHPARLFIVAVGQSSHARKGTAASDTKRLLFEADPTFHRRVVKGLSSGEGLIYNVRYAVTEWDVRQEPTRARHEGRR